VKLLDEKNRIFGIVNPVDLVAIMLAVLVVFVLAAVLFGKTPTGSMTSAGEDTIEVVLKGTVPVYADYQFKVGQEISRVSGAGVMGTVTTFTVVPAIKEAYTSEGVGIEAVSPISSEITLVVRGTGSITDVGASIGAERIRQNQTFDAQMPYFQMPVSVVSVRQVD
jgi:hypothetical protein